MKIMNEEQMGDLISKMETKVARIAAINDPVSELMQVPIFKSSLANFPQYAAAKAVNNTKNAREITWNYILMTFINEKERHRNQ